MKRLIRNRHASIIEADAIRLVDGQIDPNAAIALIQAKDPYFKPANLIADTAAGTKSYWGAISDDGLFSCEAYMYTGVKDSRKVAFIIAPKDNPSKLECIVKNIDSARDIRFTAKAGFVLPSNGSKVTFNNEYTSFNDVPAQTQTAKKK
jgi:hypothetical protein